MRNASNWAQPGTTGGNREEFIRNPLTLLEPEDTPFVSQISKVEIFSTYPEALGDRMRSVDITGTAEGSSGTKGGNKATKRARFGVYPHRWHDTFGVTDVQQAVSRKGGNAATDDEYGYAVAKCIREVKRDIEASLCSSQDCQSGAVATMRTRGAFSWLATSGQVPAIPSDFLNAAAAVDTDVTALTEQILVDVLQACKSVHGGSREYAFIAGNTYVQNLDFLTKTGAATDRVNVNTPMGDHELSFMLRYFETSFGRCAIFPSEFLRCNVIATGDPEAGLLIKRDLWEFGVLEDLHSEDDPEDAGGLTGWVKCIGALLCRSPRGNGSIYSA